VTDNPGDIVLTVVTHEISKLSHRIHFNSLDEPQAKIL
jgi:hypothetical protein